MNDPHVAALRYKLITDESASYRNPPAISFERPGFRATLADGMLSIEMLDHYATENEARRRVQGFLRAWEIDVALRLGPGELGLQFDGAELIDRRPTPGVIHLPPLTAEAMAVVAEVKLHVTRAQYPRPPMCSWPLRSSRRCGFDSAFTSTGKSHWPAWPTSA